MNTNRLTLFICAAVGVLAFGCGNAPDQGNPDNYPVQVIRTIDEDGVEHIETKQLPFDYELYGQAQEALSAPPSRYGVDSAAAQSSNDTRCPAGGYTSGSNYCTATGVKHINWDFSGVDGRIDSLMNINVRTYVIQGFTVAAQDSGPSGFVHEKENSARGIDGRVFFEAGSCPVAGTSGFGFMCESSNYGPVVLAGGKRTRLSSGNFAIRLNTDRVASLHTMTPQQQAFTVMNFMGHETHHAEEFGHVPSSLGAEIMNFQTTATNQGVLHLTSAEKSQLTAWVSSF